MLKKLLIGGLLGGIAMFVRQGVWWALLPFAMGGMKPLPAGADFASQMRSQNMESGIYYHPERPKPSGDAAADKAAMEEMVETALAGPTVSFMIYQADGFDYNNPAPYIRGLSSDIIACILVTLLLSLCAACMPAFGQRVLFCAGIGLATALTGPVVLSGFFFHPQSFVVAQVVDATLGWAVAGLLIALATRPQAVKAAVA